MHWEVVYFPLNMVELGYLNFIMEVGFSGELLGGAQIYFLLIRFIDFIRIWGNRFFYKRLRARFGFGRAADSSDGRFLLAVLLHFMGALAGIFRRFLQNF